MANDGEVRIGTKLDTSGVDEGLKKLKGSLDNAEKNIESGAKKNKTFNDSLKNIKTSTAAATAGFAAAAVAIKKTVSALNACEAAYKVQLKAETALTNAAKNNPYLNGESVDNLKTFASEIQRTSEIGDEAALQIMAMLASTGRSEEQIKAIMGAAVDMAAVTGNSLQNVALQLNKTYSGLAGELGEANGAIRALTKEELENGKAIEIVAAQYNGQAAAMADNTVQLSNAWGDFKENIGRGWSKVTTPVKNFFLDVLNDINEINSKTADLKAANTAAETGTETAAQAKLRLEEAQALLEELDANKGMTEKKGGIMAGYMVDPEWQKKRDAQAETVAELTRRYNFLADSEKYEARQAERAAAAAAKTAEEREKAAQRDKDAQAHIDANAKALAQQVQAMELEADLLGKKVDAGEMYNVYLQSYIDLVTKSNGLVTEANSAATARLALLNQWAQEAKNAATEEERLAAAEEAAKIASDLLKEKQAETAELLDDVYGENAQSRLQELQDKEVHLAALKDQINANEIMSEAEKAAALMEIDEQSAQNRKEIAAQLAEDISGYSQQSLQVVQDMTALMLRNVQSETDLELATLESKYSKGELAESEYYEKQQEIKRKAAREEYKIKMFEWTASMLSATANIAEGVTKAIAQGGAAGLLTGLLVSAAGAVQLGSILAAKPTPPSFYTGGIIGGPNGASMGGDNTYVHARTGEMVINAAQQRALWDMIASPGGAALGDVIVNNTQSGRVDTNIRQEKNGLVIDILDKHINRGLGDGTYDGGLANMNTRQEGIRIL